MSIEGFITPNLHRESERCPAYSGELLMNGERCSLSCGQYKTEFKGVPGNWINVRIFGSTGKQKGQGLIEVYQRALPTGGNLFGELDFDGERLELQLKLSTEGGRKFLRFTAENKGEAMEALEG